HEIAGAKIDPGVLVDLPAEEAAAVGTFFADDLGALDVCRIVDQQRAPFAAGEIFGFVKTLGRHASKCSQRPVLVCAEQAMGVVFDDSNSMTPGDFADRVHLASNARVMNGNDCPGAAR